MPMLNIDVSILEQELSGLGLSPAQLLSWLKKNRDTITAVQGYLRTNRFATDSEIENNAVAGQTIDPTTLERVLKFLEATGRIERMEIT